MGRKLFCEISPVCYQISLKKEYIKRDLKDLFSNIKFAKTIQRQELPNIVKSHCSILIRRLRGIDLTLQENKVTNIMLACQKINGILINPGETFSFHRIVGKTTKKRGYKPGLLISRKGFGSGYGGGLCQMANMIHYLVLHSPLNVTEIHHHSDALFPDERRRVPFGTGTSIFYKHIDYRFKNDTDQAVQILVWINDGELCGELRSERPFPFRYRLIEENHHFRKEGNDYYRISWVFRMNIDRKTNEEIKKELILDNHSKVMYDHSLIPKEQIRGEYDDRETQKCISEKR